MPCRQRDLRADARAILAAAVAAAAPGPQVVRALSRRRRQLAARPVHLLALGKAASPMAAAALSLDWLRPLTALAVGPAGTRGSLPRRARFLAGEHPLPGPGSFAAGRALLAAARKAGAGETVLLLLSGGGSALAAVPRPGLGQEGKRRILARLLDAGLPVSEMNLLRASLSALKGGGLARAALPARTVTLALMDVPLGAPWALASGPARSAPAGSAAKLAAHLPDLGLGQDVTRLLLDALALQERLPPLRVPAPFLVIGDRRLAASGAAREARRLGYRCRIVPGRVRGEATRLGLRLGEEAVRLSRAAGSPICVIRTGEPVAHPPAGSGPGGRCQQAALAAATRLAGVRRALVLAAGTDGRDGPGSAAGALADGGTVERATRAGLDPEADLARHAAGASLAAAGDLLRTGPTGTNVNDLFLVLARRS